MKQESILRGRMWLMLLVLFAWFVPQQVSADDGYETFVDQSILYNVYVSGSNTVNISVPCYDQEGADTWIENGNLYASWDGSNGEKTVLHWAADKNIADDRSTCPVSVSNNVPGYLILKLGNTDKEEKLNSDGSGKWNIVHNDDKRTFSLSAIWVVPQELQGKTITLRWRVDRNGNSRDHVWLDEKGNLSNPAPITIPAANPVSPPFISAATIDNNHKGKIIVPWTMIPNKISKLRYEYTDANGRKQTADMPTTSNGGNVLLDAFEPHRNFRIIADYYESQTRDEYLIKDVPSESVNLAMVHMPHGLTALPLGGVNSKVEVKWNISSPTTEDVAEIDFFEVQRSLTGKEEDFTTIGQVPFARIGATAKSAYTFVDSTFVDGITESMLKDGYTLENLTYRVRRGITSNWGWGSDNICAASTKCVVDNLHLLRFAECSGKWEDERAYTLRVSWNYGSEPNGVWDDRAKMMVRVTSKNTAGEVVETRDFEVNKEEREQCYKIVDLSRPCVTYDVELYVDRGTSPINVYDKNKMKDYFFPINNANDWATFKKKVEDAKGQYDVNARLYADITITDPAGTNNAAYRGTFDGNGHALTFNKSGVTEQYMAPFRYVGNARFIGLHTKGTISTSQKFAGGLIARVVVNANVIIENCHSTMTLNSSVNGDATNGGFVAYSSGNVDFINCKFDGSFEGANCHHNGGFIGWNDQQSNVTFNNSVFAPDHINTSSEGCETWIRKHPYVTVTVLNSYATMEYSSVLTIRSASDWTAFKQRVADAKNQYDVNAVLDADITVTDYVGGGSTATFRGTFDGNGHTLTFNNTSGAEYIAPFRYVSNATFNNLNVKGTISTSQKFAGGLVAQVVNGAAVTIENCHSSVTLKSSVSGDATNGGFVARSIGSGTTVTIKNSKFDGSFEGTNCHSNGGFVGYTDGPVIIENSLFAPDHISTKVDHCATWSRLHPDAKLTVKNSYFTKDYSVLVISKNSDWDTFCTMITDAKGAYKVNAILTADISVTKPAATSDDVARWTGTLDGNGHTININYESTDSYNALFRSTKDFTIKNLHLTGTIKGLDYAAGLVGLPYGENNNIITNCRVSVEITSKVFGGSGSAGGFVGYTQNRALTITNCLFDGKIIEESQYHNLKRAAAFIGYQYTGYKNNVFKNNLENGSGYTPKRTIASFSDHDVAVGMNFCEWSDRGSANNVSWGSNNWTYHEQEDRHVTSYYTSVCWSEAYQVGNKSAKDLANQLGSGDWQVNSEGKVVPKMTDSYSTNAWLNGSITAAQQVAALGKDYWMVVDGKAVPITPSTGTSGDASGADIYDNLAIWTRTGNTAVPPTTTVDYEKIESNIMHIISGFYHESTGKIEKKVIAETRQSSVLLTWNTDGNPIDRFTVLRREVGQGDDAWKEIKDNIDQMSYEDTSASPIKKYEYKVRAVNDCEGISYTESDAVQGACKNTGRVSGYVRFNDGTGIANAEIQVRRKSGGSDIVEKTVKTDDKGYFVADELSYYGGESITYIVRATVAKAEFENDAYETNVTFDAEHNDRTTDEFTVINGMRFSGFVMYKGTSIPVKGAHFKVNGKELHNSKGNAVETDYDGSFSFRLLKGNHTIQVAMDGHKFVNDGWYVSSSEQSITADISQFYFYDNTKVKLTGRVVGGDDQGKMPLDNNLSKNNLGDNLKMVLALEGDDTSWLVYENTNPNRTERDTTYLHNKAAKGVQHLTKVKTQRKRMEVTPDPATGEYMLMLPPVRWKVQQISCEGYPTLFQEGQVGDVIDLTDCLTPKDTTYVGDYKDVDGNSISQPKASYNAVYNRIYHNPIELTYKQLGYDSFDYLGDKTYTATNLKGDKVQVQLAYKNPADTTKALYSLGHPVFSLERKYYIQVQVAERYPYNNDNTNEKTDLVRIGGGVVTMHNGMKNGVAIDTLHLNNQGQATFELRADHVAQPVGADNALKTVTFTVAQDGRYFEATPLQGYVLNQFQLSSGKELLTEGQPLLFDILRDPPGAYSSSTLAKGATLNSSYAMNLSMAGGVTFNFSVADKVNWFQGYADGSVHDLTSTIETEFDGVEHNAEKVDVSFSDLVFNYNGSKAWSHTMVLGNNVSTSGDPTMVGADADLYIGMVQNVQIAPMSTVRAIPDDMYQALKARTGIGASNTTGEIAKNAKYGTLVEIASGKNEKGETIHLVRDLSIAYGPKLKSQFVYSQKQILNQIIPDKVDEILNLMFIGTQEEAQAIANSTGKAVYRSLRETTDPKFALRNKKYNTDVRVANDSTHYVIVLPQGKNSSDFPDEIAEKSEIIYAWSKMITQNEHEKLNATDLVNNFDIAGAQGVNYSETFSSSYSNSTSMYFPYGVQPDYFKGKGSGIGTSVASTAVNYLVAGFFGYLESFKKKDPTISGGVKEQQASLQFDDVFFRWSLTPVLTSTNIGTTSISSEYNRTESFTIAAAPTSRLSVDVYRVKMGSAATWGNGKVSPEDVFSNYNFKNLSNDALEYLKDNGNAPDFGAPSSFVFRTRGGVTSNPWEDARKTHFYNAGSLLDERTLKVDNPTIRLDKNSISGVSFNDAARFKVYLSNESEKPEATGGLSTYTLYSVDQANPNGAKLSVNGQTLTSGGMTVTVVPGVTTQLEMEVRAGSGFDYEGLTLGLMSPTDPVNARATTKFDVHFLREAGAVTIATPGDKWILNTNAQKDEKRGWYIPVTINGFDRHQQNFDHIEFQYKESQRGDDSWVNLCSFYADSTLMANANGVREMMKPNANIVTNFYGEGFVIEKSYDLRAVLFCRNGSQFLTTPSKVISGVKDTRRPQLFSTPEPKSGLLNMNDNIIFNFSEDIEYNNLSAITNFDVKGEVNNNDLTENVSVQFSGKASMETDAKRNFTGKDLTIDLMVSPADTKRDMPLFSHGSNDQKLQLWLTADSKLKAEINGQTYTSDGEISRKGFTEVTLSINQKDSLLTFYKDGKMASQQMKMTGLYSGTGPLVFGRTNETDRNQSQYYEGRMMEARLWYSANSGGGYKRLTGYEKNLVDYYPMDEGSGDIAIDKTQGANARLIGTSWAIPRGMSLRLNKEGIQLTANALNRTVDQDYTLMFWFKTDAEGRGTLLSSGTGLKEESGAENKFNIGFDGEKLMYRSNGLARELEGNWSDNQWHHYAMTVNRARNVVNIYVDHEQRTTFAADSLGGMSGNALIGATRTLDADGKMVASNAITGYIDELGIFAQALPKSLIDAYSTKSPNGDEGGLMQYMSFDRMERQSDNQIKMVPYAYSKKIELDAEGKVRMQEDPVTKELTNIPVRHYLFEDLKENEIVTRIDATQAAPVLPYEELTNLKFSFIGKGNQLLVELDEPAAKLNHRNIYVTVRDVEDKNGNALASPQTATYHVTNSSLEWVLNKLDIIVKYGTAEELTMPFYNNSAVSHTYKIENCPQWLTLSGYSDMIAPQDMGAVTATVSKDLNVGTYNEIIYLTDENGLSEPLFLNITVEGEKPEWTKNINSDLLKNSMSITGQVYLYGELDTDPRDIVGVFDNENVCHGYANISHTEQTGETALYLTVYDKVEKGSSNMKFRLWQYSTGREIVLTTTPGIIFEKDKIIGTDKPVRFDGGDTYMQYFKLSKGWNWVSFNAKSEQMKDVNVLLKNMTWSEDDVITELGGTLTLVYKNNEWLQGGTKQTVAISPKSSYAIKVQKDCNFPIEGSVIKDKADRTIEVKSGWHGIGYTPTVNLSVETALSDYYDDAQDGDVIKSHTEFAYFSKSGNVGRWRGNLQYMKPGEGYMMLRKGTNSTQFTYPYYYMGSNSGEVLKQNTNSNRAQAIRNTMSLSAVVAGFETEPGDVLVAYCNGEVVGEATVVNATTAETRSNDTESTEPLYLSIAGEAKDGIWFAIERDGDIVASTGEIMTFKANDVIGSPDKPTAINFTYADSREDGKWYTVSGMRLTQKPTQIGVYIYNGRKVVIK